MLESTLPLPTTPSSASGILPAAPLLPRCWAASADSAGCLRWIGKRWKEPVLVSSADGVGTKLKVAMAMGVHSTVGGDLVNHCVNDILVQGAEPLFFLDYLAMGKLDPNVVEQLVDGMSRRLPQSRLRADRRRNRGDAGLLSAG